MALRLLHLADALPCRSYALRVAQSGNDLRGALL